MSPFEEGFLPPEAFDVEGTMKKFGMSRAMAEKEVRRLATQKIWMNDTYQVNIDYQPPQVGDFPRLIHLSIKRRDKLPIHDWRDLQEIKNRLVGPEHEAIELYPAESRLVDTSNQFHLWVLWDPELRLPFGYTDRLVTGVEDAEAIGARQREFNT
jgi:hypothetical protein